MSAYDYYDAGDFGEIPDGDDACPTGPGNYSIAVHDWTGKRVEGGDVVHYFDQPPTPENRGTVIRVTDFDGDVDDDTGRSISLTPDVYVRFPDGEVLRCSTSEWEHDYCAHSDEDGYPAACCCDSVGKVEELLVWRDHNRERGTESRIALIASRVLDRLGSSAHELYGNEWQAVVEFRSVRAVLSAVRDGRIEVELAHDDGLGLAYFTESPRLVERITRMIERADGPSVGELIRAGVVCPTCADEGERTCECWEQVTR